jgi:DNA-directed RNA polymerase specialized sigma24 family protein
VAYNGRVGVEVEELVAKAATGDEEAWSALWLYAEPMLLRLARSPRVSGKMSESEDDCRNVVVEVMARLRDAEFRRLKLYLERRAHKPDLTFEPWLRVVARRVTIDYMRGLGEYIDRRRSRNPGSAAGMWVHQTSLTSTSRLHGVRPAITNQDAAMKMVHFAYNELPADQIDALGRWIVGDRFAKIAEGMQLDGADDAKKLVRAALQRLRREFRDKSKKKGRA